MTGEQPGAELATVPERPQRLVFLGTPTLATPSLRALHAAGYDVALVVSRADKRRGRGGAVNPSPVKAVAQELGLPVTTELTDALEVGADAGIVVAFGRLVPGTVLEQLPMLNLHFSLLPRWRGAAPVERAILAGDGVTGVCLMQLEEELDTGPVFACSEVPIVSDESAAHLRQRLVATGTRLLLDELSRGLGAPVAQVGTPTYASPIDPDELHIDWTDDAVHLARLCRIGGAWTTFRGRRLKVLEARVDGPVDRGGGDALGPGELRGTRVGTGAGVLELVEVQPEGRRRVPAGAWRNGAQPRDGERLGS